MDEQITEVASELTFLSSRVFSDFSVSVGVVLLDIELRMKAASSSSEILPSKPWYFFL